jgi:hypothetical protein
MTDNILLEGQCSLLEYSQVQVNMCQFVASKGLRLARLVPSDVRVVI